MAECHSILKQSREKKNDSPLSLFQSARNTILKATGIDKSKDVIQELDLPKSLLTYLTTAFGTDDFFVNKDDVTPEDVKSGIYRAVCRLDNKAVILKVIEKEELTKERFEILNKWENISVGAVQRCYTSFLQKQKVVYVMEYVRRADDIIRNAKTQKNNLTEKTIWYTLHHLTKVLTALKDMGLVCKDLKPSKVGFCADGEIRLENEILSLSDNNSAMENLIMDDDEPTGVYTPPEVILGDDATDSSLVWLIGAVLYEMVALEPAYKIEDAANIFEALNDISEGKAPPDLSDEYSEELKQIIQKCMSTAQEDRPTLKELISCSDGKFNNTTKSEIIQLL